MTGRILDARQPVIASFDPDEDAQPRRPRRTEPRWPVNQPTDALDAACRAGHAHFIREPDPAKAEARWNKLPDKARQARMAETLAIVTAWRAAGGR